MWMAEVNDDPEDLRDMPRGIHEIAFETGMILYIPDHRERSLRTTNHALGAPPCSVPPPGPHDIHVSQYRDTVHPVRPAILTGRSPGSASAAAGSPPRPRAGCRTA